MNRSDSMLITYPALFYYFDEAEDDKFLISFPDFDHRGTSGNDTIEAMQAATDCLGHLIASAIESGEKIPLPSTIGQFDLEKDYPFDDGLSFDADRSFASLVLVDLNNYLEDYEPVKSTVLIPKWADELGRKLNLNYSKVLLDGINQENLRQN